MSDLTPKSEVQTILFQAAQQNVHLILLVLSIAPSYPVTAYGALPYGGVDVPDGWIEELATSRKRLETQSDTMKALLQSEGASGDVHSVHTVPAEVRDIVASRGMVSDVATVVPSLREDHPDVFRAAVSGVLFDSPVGLHLNGSPLAKPNRVLVAWNTDLPAARAVHSALPLLCASSEVVIACFDPVADATENGEDPGADIARWLSHHGCTATVNQYPTGGIDVGTAILRRATEIGAELVVMGAYGRSRIRELVFGGTTRTMLEQTEIPVLMTH